MANTWQGVFPATDTAEDGFKGTAPVASFAANGYGLFDMTGNVWQHVSDWYRAETYREQAGRGVAHNPAGPASSFDPDEPLSPKHVIRGAPFYAPRPFASVSARRADEALAGSPPSGEGALNDVV